jgi:hypothetical protein
MQLLVFSPFSLFATHVNFPSLVFWVLITEACYLVFDFCLVHAFNSCHRDFQYIDFFIPKSSVVTHDLVNRTPFKENLNKNSEVLYNAYLVWKMFWIIFCGDSLAAYSNWSNSSELKRQPRAPKFSSACFTVLIPGIGIAPLQMHQFIATC